MWKGRDRQRVALRVRSPLQNGLVVVCGCGFAVIGFSILVAGKEPGDSWGTTAVVGCLAVLFGIWAVAAGWRQGVYLVGNQILVRRPGKRTIRLKRPAAVHFDSYAGTHLQLRFDFTLDCLAIENGDGSLTQLPGIAVWSGFPGHGRINLERALVIDDMICRVQTGAPRPLTAERREHFHQLQRPPAAPKHQAP